MRVAAGWLVLIAAIGVLTSPAVQGDDGAKPSNDLEKALEELDGSPASPDSPREPKKEFGSTEEANRELQGDEEEDEEIDPVESLKTIKQLMEEAQRSLSKASTVDPKEAVKQQTTVIAEIDKLLGGSKKNQQGALEEIERLIKHAKG
ncbi:MAG: hypothetical protein HYY93_02250 [Planctomycetes bacterium]|nr:hypothetical protein [Planctomycetota bacterium]